MAQAILANLGPQGDPSDLLALAAGAIDKTGRNTQSKFYRDRPSWRRRRSGTRAALMVVLIDSTTSTA
jgi:hypothetical protein